MKPVISFNNTKCHNCLKCLKACPQDAISIVNEVVHIDEDKCIHCDVCLLACVEKKLSVKSAHLHQSLDEFDYKVALMPTAILSDIKTYDDLGHIVAAIKKLGFDEVVQYSDIEGSLYREGIKYSKEHEGVFINPMCPTINRMIERDFPTLVDHLLPFDYPVEVAAKLIRKKYKDRNIGIFSLCECVGKMTLAKQPFDNQESNIDYAISISHIFPAINKLKNQDREEVKVSQDGVKSIVADLYTNDTTKTISVEGKRQCRTALDLIEFDQLKNIKLVSLYACYQGCIGGYYLWNNPFEGCINVESMFSCLDKSNITLEKEDYFKIHDVEDESVNYKERIIWFKKVNSILEKLPQFDCGSCGFANCRNLAISIAKGEVDESLCRVKKVTK
ncbi:MAG: [Fe-Fe] hydrogenase large subunit C-terminal domain-containing protein [Thomasclavelia sp.]|jgi:iron only hydrogenase large subunit-like protein|nr:[Fe-Fe] hydrogenase large subunit C-terminal domain-containing protein [Thomasclavelia sp.]